MPTCEWAWDHLLELGQLIGSHIPEEHSLSLSSQLERAPQLNVGTSQAPLSLSFSLSLSLLSMLGLWLAWFCVGFVTGKI